MSFSTTKDPTDFYFIKIIITVRQKNDCHTGFFTGFFSASWPTQRQEKNTKKRAQSYITYILHQMPLGRVYKQNIYSIRLNIGFIYLSHSHSIPYSRPNHSANLHAHGNYLDRFTSCLPLGFCLFGFFSFLPVRVLTRQNLSTATLSFLWAGAGEEPCIVRCLWCQCYPCITHDSESLICNNNLLSSEKLLSGAVK